MIVTDSSDQRESESRRPSGGRWRYVLGVAAVVVCVFTALQVREFFLAGPAGSPSGSPPGVIPTTQAWQTDADAAGNPMALRHAAEREGALEKWTGDPAGLSPPPGASAMTGWQQRSYGSTRQTRTYDCHQPLDEVANHYRRAATDKGLTHLTEHPSPGEVQLQWLAPDLHVMVNIRQEPTKQTRVTVTASWTE